MTTHAGPDWASEMFPGWAADMPDDDERGRADAVIAKWSTQWREDWEPIPRTHATIDGTPPTNRAFMRAALRRWWAKK